MVVAAKVRLTMPVRLAVDGSSVSGPSFSNEAASAATFFTVNPDGFSILQQTQANGVAVGHFNIADLVLLKAVFASAQELTKSPDQSA